MTPITFAQNGRKQDAKTGQAGPIKVGVYADLSGQTSSFGLATVNGFKMAVDEINIAGGVDGRQIELVIADDQGLPSNAATVAKNFIDGHQIVALLGEVSSVNSLSAAPFAQAAHMPMITPSSTNPKVTRVGDYIFRTCFIDPYQGSAMAQFARNTLQAKTAAIFGDVNSDYSKGLTDTFRREFVNGGGVIVDERTYTQDDSDFREQLKAMRSRKPDVIYLPGYYSQAGVIIKQARKLGLRQPFLGGDGWDSPRIFQIGGDAMNGNYFSTHYSPDDPAPAVQEFAAKYRLRFNTAPDAIAALAYDAMNILAEAIKRAGTTDGPKLRDAIAQTAHFPGVTGDTTLDGDRNAIKPAVIMEFKNGEQVYKETIKP